MNKNTEKVMSSFSKDVKYFETPKLKLKYDEIKSAWELIKEQQEIKLKLSLLGHTNGAYDVKWELSYNKQERKYIHSGICKIQLDEK